MTSSTIIVCNDQMRPNMPSQWLKQGMIRRSPIQPTVDHTPKYTCISCRKEHAVMIGGLRGRILRGYSVFRSGRFVIRDTPDPDTTPKPMYGNGRVCPGCTKRYTKVVGSKPNDYSEIQFLKDDIVITPRKPVTQHNVEVDDALKELEDQQNALKYTGATGRIKSLIDMTQVASGEKPKIDQKAYNYFISHRGRSKVGKSFDKDINFNNQKKG